MLRWLRRIVVWRFRVRLIPTRARHFELSVVSSTDGHAGASRELFELGLQASQRAVDIDLSSLHNRSAAAQQFLSIFPGEHYHLLAALVTCLNPSRVVEIGTYTGLSALAMMTSLDDNAVLTSYDIVPWNEIPTTALRPTDFEGGRLEQRIGDLGEAGYFEQNKDRLTMSDIIFVDGPKDGRFEPAFVRMLLEAPRSKPGLLVFDDIRLWNMLSLWESLDRPKMDLTSFGHWTGTGVCWLSPA